MNRRQADIVAGVLIVGILSIGIFSSLQLYVTGDAMMGQMESAPVIHYLGPLLGSLLVASVVGGVYVFVRNQIFTVESGTTPSTGETADAVVEPEAATTHPILEVLPDDERRILEPVIESPGLTQVKVCDRSGFSRSKVSQTITDLEERGLLYREPQGRTYRVYPAEDLDDRV